MIELFDFIKKNTSHLIKVKASRISYWRSNTTNNFIQYLEDNINKIIVDKYDIEYGKVFDDTYIKSFDIECKVPNEIYDYLQNNYARIFNVYNKNKF